jgi:hypothetical protein
MRITAAKTVTKRIYRKVGSVGNVGNGKKESFNDCLMN